MTASRRCVLDGTAAVALLVAGLAATTAVGLAAVDVAFVFSLDDRRDAAPTVLADRWFGAASWPTDTLTVTGVWWSAPATWIGVVLGSGTVATLAAVAKRLTT